MTLRQQCYIYCSGIPVAFSKLDARVFSYMKEFPALSKQGKLSVSDVYKTVIWVSTSILTVSRLETFSSIGLTGFSIWSFVKVRTASYSTKPSSSTTFVQTITRHIAYFSYMLLLTRMQSVLTHESTPNFPFRASSLNTFHVQSSSIHMLQQLI